MKLIHYSHPGKTHPELDRACYKMASSSKHQIEGTVDASGMNGSFGRDHRAAPATRFLPNDVKSLKSDRSPSPELTEVSVPKLSSIFGTSASSKKHFAKMNHISAKADSINNGCIDYLSVLKPCRTSEWNRSLLSDKSSSRSVSCIIRSDDKDELIDTQSVIDRTRPSSLYDQGQANGEESYKSISDDEASKQSDFGTSGPTLSSISSLSSMRSSPLPPQSKRQTNNLPEAKCLHGQASTLPRLKSILKNHKQQHSGQVGGNGEIMFSNPNDEVSDEVPFFRRILKSSEYSDSILFGGRPTLDSKTVSVDPHECAGVDNEQAAQCATQRKLSRHNSTSVADSTDLPKYELQDQTSHKSSKTDSKNDCIDYLSVLKKNRKDSSSKCIDTTINSSNEKDSNSQNLPFYKLKLRKTDHSALLIEVDNSNICSNNIDVIKGNNPNNASPDSDPRQESTTNFTSKVFVGNISSMSSPLSSSSSCSPSSKSHQEQIETNSNSQESIRSSSSELSFVDYEPSVVLRKLSTDGHLGARKRRAIIRLSADCSSPSRFGDKDLASISPGGTSDEEEPLNLAKSRQQDDKKVRTYFYCIYCYCRYYELVLRQSKRTVYIMNNGRRI